jgi:hypothetical protein
MKRLLLPAVVLCALLSAGTASAQFYPFYYPYYPRDYVSDLLGRNFARPVGFDYDPRVPLTWRREPFNDLPEVDAYRIWLQQNQAQLDPLWPYRANTVSPIYYYRPTIVTPVVPAYPPITPY